MGRLPGQGARQGPLHFGLSIMTLLDTGLRASELGFLNQEDLNLDDMSLLVRQGKGGKFRTVYFSPITARVLRRYLRTRRDADPALVPEPECRAFEP